jgi:hypothetical protein
MTLLWNRSQKTCPFSMTVDQSNQTAKTFRRSITYVLVRSSLVMNVDGDTSSSLATTLSNFLSSFLIHEPPSPQSAFSAIIAFINEHKPFVAIEPNSPILHKWNTRVSSLLQSKSAESRYWGICLAKATLLNRGNGVDHAVTWSRLLLALLNV